LLSSNSLTIQLQRKKAEQGKKQSANFISKFSTQMNEWTLFYEGNTS
jgi:hypothetical protein